MKSTILPEWFPKDLCLSALAPKFIPLPVNGRQRDLASGCELNSPFEFPLRGSPVPLVPLVLDGENDVGIGIAQV